MNSDRLKALGWTEQMSWENGLKITVDWYKKHSSRFGNIEGVSVTDIYIVTACHALILAQCLDVGCLRRAMELVVHYELEALYSMCCFTLWILVRYAGAHGTP